MSSVTLTGWGQPHDALANMAPHARHIEYTHMPDIEQALVHIAQQARTAECVIGWSMGGLLACQLIARKMIKPEKLVLVATPFQFVETPSLKLGMKKPLYDQFVDNYRRNPLRTLKKAYQLITHGDKFKLLLPKGEGILDYDWLYWLEALEHVSCVDMDFSHFPHTTLIHGLNDVVVTPDNSKHFHTHLPASDLKLIEHCGHAPHWHSNLFPPLAGG